MSTTLPLLPLSFEFFPPKTAEGMEKLRSEPFDLGVFTHCGIDPTRKRYVILKSRQHFRAGFEPIARHIVMCDGDGCTTSDLALLNFRNIRRPLYPFDPDMVLGRNDPD